MINICFIGAGFVGGCSGAVFASKCPNNIYVLDSDENKIKMWNSNNFPIKEKYLQELIEKKNKNLTFTTDNRVLKKCELIFICVNTPNDTKDKPNLKYIESAMETIAKRNNKAIIVTKSTVPVGGNDRLINFLRQKNNSGDYSILSNPEFLSEGNAIKNLLEPDRVVIGGDKETGKILGKLYENWVDQEKLLYTSIESAELGKLLSNAMLAQRVASINTISRVCEETGSNIKEIQKIVGSDRRIGEFFIRPSLGFGGSCFKKDINNLVDLAKSKKLFYVADYWSQLNIMNTYQINDFVNMIISNMFNEVKKKTITIFGFAFKNGTNDTRESPAITVCKELLHEGAYLKIYDPFVNDLQIMSDLGPPVEIPEKKFNYSIENNPNDACKDSRALVFCTNHENFKLIDFQTMFNLMYKPAYVFDGHNMFEKEMLEKIGFFVKNIGNSF